MKTRLFLHCVIAVLAGIAFWVFLRLEKTEVGSPLSVEYVLVNDSSPTVELDPAQFPLVKFWPGHLRMFRRFNNVVTTLWGNKTKSFVQGKTNVIHDYVLFRSNELFVGFFMRRLFPESIIIGNVHIVGGSVSGVYDSQSELKLSRIFANPPNFSHNVSSLGINRTLLSDSYTFLQSFVLTLNRIQLPLHCRDHVFILSDKFARLQYGFAHNPDLPNHRFGLQFHNLFLPRHYVCLTFNRGQLLLHSLDHIGIVFDQVTGFSQSIFHYPQLPAIYSGLYRNGNKNKKLKKNKWIRPLCGIGLVLLSFIPGLPGIQLWYRARYAWSGLLLAVSGALAFGGSLLALSEPKAQN